jgi:hypothetical protein
MRSAVAMQHSGMYGNKTACISIASTVILVVKFGVIGGINIMLYYIVLCMI